MSLARALAGECLGTFALVAAGTGTVASAVLLGRPSETWQVAIAWGLAVGAAAAATARHSGAHLNPAVSLALAAWRPSEFPRARLVPYAAAQLAGAMLAGLVVLAAFGGDLAAFEAREGLVRGAPGSERAAMVFGEYFPNPAAVAAARAAGGAIPEVTAGSAAALEAAGTGALVLAIFGISRAAAGRPAVARAAPWLVGATVAGLIVLLAESTQACLNPARDLGPRLVAWAAGWGAIALPGPGGGAWVYLAGPLAGGLLGGLAGSRLFPEAGSSKGGAA